MLFFGNSAWIQFLQCCNSSILKPFRGIVFHNFFHFGTFLFCAVKVVLQIVAAFRCGNAGDIAAVRFFKSYIIGCNVAVCPTCVKSGQKRCGSILKLSVFCVLHRLSLCHSLLCPFSFC